MTRCLNEAGALAGAREARARRETPTSNVRGRLGKQEMLEPPRKKKQRKAEFGGATPTKTTHSPDIKAPECFATPGHGSVEIYPATTQPT